VTENPPASGVIHDIGYRHYTGARLGQGYIVRTLFLDSLRGAYGFGRATRAKVVPLLLLGGMCLPAFIIVGVLTASGSTTLPLAYAGYFVAVNPPILLFVAAQAPAAVSRDLRSRVMSLYLSRPLTRAGYVAAKYGALSSATFILTGLPLLILYAGALVGQLPFGTQTVQVAQALVGVLLLSLVLSGIALLIASVTPRRGVGVAAIVTVLIVLAAVESIVRGISSASHHVAIERYAGLLNPYSLIDGVQVWMFGTEPATGAPPPSGIGGPVYLLVTLAVIAGSVGLLLLRYRRVNVS